MEHFQLCLEYVSAYEKQNMLRTKLVNELRIHLFIMVLSACSYVALQHCVDNMGLITAPLFSLSFFYFSSTWKSQVIPLNIALAKSLTMVFEYQGVSKLSTQHAELLNMRTSTLTSQKITLKEVFGVNIGN